MGSSEAEEKRLVSRQGGVARRFRERAESKKQTRRKDEWQNNAVRVCLAWGFLTGNKIKKELQVCLALLERRRRRLQGGPLMIF